jgi:hypothetical protein
MSDDPGSLANLRDLAIPPEVSFWPPAPGAWILLAACAAILSIMVWRAVQRYRAAAHRRAAIAELDAIASGIERGEPAIVERVSAVIKRVAMVEYGRERVAPLSGEAWADFVATTGAGLNAQTIRSLFSEVYVAARQPGPSELRQLIDQASGWVRAHRARLGAEA